MGNHKSVQRPTRYCSSQGCALGSLLLMCRISYDSAQPCWEGPLTPQRTLPRLGPPGMAWLQQRSKRIKDFVLTFKKLMCKHLHTKN